MVGVRFSLGLMWLTLIVAETISANAGIGYLAMNAREFLQTDVVVVAIILYALLGKLADVSAQLLERIWLRWNPAYHVNAAFAKRRDETLRREYGTESVRFAYSRRAICCGSRSQRRWKKYFIATACWAGIAHRR